MINRSDLKFIIPFVSVFFIVCGMIHQIIYYSAFGVKINNFMDLPESIALFINDLMFDMGCIIFGAIIGLIIGGEEGGNIWQRIYEEPNFWNRLKFYLRRASFLIVMSATLLSVSVVLLIIRYKNAYYALLFSSWIPLFIIYLIAMSEYRVKFKKKYKKELKAKIIVLFSYGIIIFSQIIFSTLSDINLVKNDKKYYGVSFRLDDDLVISDSTKYYIGKTKNYLFYYNQKANKTTVYPMERIKEITFINK